MFATYASVMVNNEKLEHHGKAGKVLESKAGETTTIVQIDGEDEPTEFNNADLKGL